MRLLSLNEVQSKLDAEFLPLEPTVTGLRLVVRKTPCKFAKCKSRLGIVFPKSFIDVAGKFDLGKFTIGQIVFGANTATLLEMNDAQDTHWWGEGLRPRNQVAISSGDPFTILLDTSTGQIRAITEDDGWKRDETIVAKDFELFLRGLGTAYILRVPESSSVILAKQVGIAVGANVKNKFWAEFAR